MTGDCLILGAGGHAASVIDAMRCAGLRPAAILDKDPDLKGRSVLNVPVVGDDAALGLELCRSTSCFVVAVHSTRSGELRRSLFDRACAAGKRPQTVINPRAHPGMNVIANSLAAVEHDCGAGDHSHIATDARFCGSVSIGAGAVVLSDIPAAATAVGVPVRIL